MLKDGKGGTKTLTGLNFEEKIDFIDWFKDPSYKDVLDYINSVNCHYKFNELPLAWHGLPSGKNK